MATHAQGSSALRPGDRPAGASSTRSGSSTRARQVRNPVMFVVLGRQRPHDAALRPGARRAGARRRPGSSSGVSLWLWFTVLFANFAEAMAEGRGKAQADALRKRAPRRRRPRSSPTPQRERAHPTWSSAATLRKGDVVLVEAGDIDPRRRRGRRGRRLGRRERHHRRERAGHPRERRRPQRGHRRHARALRLARRAHHRQPGRDLPRPHDRDGRGREAAEDAERDRARHPAGGAHDHLPAGDA